jgi:hypothetical protein
MVDFLSTFLHASLIYIYEELRECPKWTNVCICSSQRIRSGLQMEDLSTALKHCPDLLLWIILLGRSGNSPLGDHGRLWYATAIAGMANNFGLKIPPSLTGLEYFELAEGIGRKGIHKRLEIRNTPESVGEAG